MLLSPGKEVAGCGEWQIQVARQLHLAHICQVCTGLVCLELFKVVQTKQVEAYRNTFANLALPLFAMAEPITPKVRCVFCLCADVHWLQCMPIPVVQMDMTDALCLVAEWHATLLQLPSAGISVSQHEVELVGPLGSSR